MPWRFSASLLPTFLGGVIAAVLAMYTWRRRERRGALPFAIFLGGLCLWSFAYGIELGFSTPGPTLAWDAIAFIGSVIVPTAWLVLTLEYAGFDDWLTPGMVGLLAIEPVLTLLLVWTNESHHLIWENVTMHDAGAIVTPELTFGPAYWANLGYSYLLIGAGVLVLLRVLFVAGRPYRSQTLVLLAGIVPPFLANVLFNLTSPLNPVQNLDLTSFAFAISGLIFALALFRFRLFELGPIARDQLFEVTDDGLVVLDENGHITDCNQSARDALGDDSQGKHITETVIEGAKGRLDVTVSGDTHVFEVTRTPLTDFRGDDIGELVFLRDLTQLGVLEEHEQRLSVLNRVLRHNLRNDLNVVTGLSQDLVDSLEGDAREKALTIRKTALDALETSKNARHVEATISPRDPDPVAVNVGEVVADVAERLDFRYPDASVAVEAPESVWVTAVGSEPLQAALRNLGENAITHNPSAAPNVWIAVESGEGDVTVTVADDGPGIPAEERAAIMSDRETDLLHGSGLGLWLVRWVTEASSGELEFDDREPSGTVVRVRLPKGSPPDAE